MWLLNKIKNFEFGLADSALAIPLHIGSYESQTENGKKYDTIIITFLFFVIIIYLGEME
jgi:hypothetical protein